METARVSAFAIYRGIAGQGAGEGNGHADETCNEKQKSQNGLQLCRKSKNIKRKQRHLIVKAKCLVAPVSIMEDNEIIQRYHSAGIKIAEKKSKSVTKITKKMNLKPKKVHRKHSDTLASIMTTSTTKIKSSSKSQELTSTGIGIARELSSLFVELDQISNSKERASRLFEWLIEPVTTKEFFSEMWEKKPAIISRAMADYHKTLFSTEEFDRILKEECVLFNVNLDVTSYFNGKKENHNIPGRAYPVVVWDFYKNGCSLRMLNPQAFSLNLWKVMSILQEFFGSMVGANIYLTPPGTQGFAPHYDDIEAFVLQLEGSKYWRIYNPRTEGEFLPQVSSVNLTEEDLGKPVLEVVLEPGDLLYFPRGFIHQASCLPTTHSLHVTISTYQKHTWGNLLKKILPAALEGALQDDVEFRQGLPLNYLEYTGVQHCEKVNAQRKKFIKKINSLIGRLQAYAGIDAAVDQKAKEFMHDCLPPVLSKDEIACSVHGAPTRWENGKPRDVLLDMKGDTEIRMLRSNIARLFSEDNRILLSYTVENSRIYHEVEPQSIEIDPELADGMEYLLCAYPEFKTIRSIPCADLEEKVSLASALFERGLVITKKPLSSMPEDQ
ncbi:ribosomal oxygenase 1 [Callorhinchus milii]|uniref:ribosomal oxygenase 1 n=1 Tax=Callorhinchus milii TaxID=7868 RepID=UPI001C3FF1FD|nr:ribosomal oxygenase 1 [Callorhinchus milii]